MPDASKINLVKALYRLFPAVYDVETKHRCKPCANEFPPVPLCDLVAHWNDDHEMTFEEIATKLESLPVDLSVVDLMEEPPIDLTAKGT